MTIKEISGAKPHKQEVNTDVKLDEKIRLALGENTQNAPLAAEAAPVAPQSMPTMDNPAPVVSSEIPQDRKEQIEQFVNENASVEESQYLGLITDRQGGSIIGKALTGDSALGPMTEQEQIYMTDRAVDVWKTQDSSSRNENLRDAISAVQDHPTARSALAFSMAGEEANVQRIIQNNPIVENEGAGAIRRDMLTRAISLDPAAAIRAFDGVEPQLAEIASTLSPQHSNKLWSTVADGNLLSPEQTERMATSLFMYESADNLWNPERVKNVANSIAQARRPGTTEADAQARSLIANNLQTALRDGDAREMLFGENVMPQQRVWALNNIAEQETAIPRDMYADGWESEAISRAYAEQATNAYQSRGSDPHILGGEALRNTIGQALGFQPDVLPEGEITQDFLNNGMNNQFYSNTDANKPIDNIADHIKNIGGDNAAVTVIPVTVTSADQGPATVPVFRVENPETGQAQFVDNAGRVYENFEDWQKNNVLPKGRMTYVEGLDLKSQDMTFENTPGVIDTFGEAFGATVDVVAIGAGVVAGGFLIFGTGGMATPLVVAGAAGAWGAGRAGADLHDMAQHGQDISDLSDPSVRSKWLEVAAGTLSVGAIGGGMRLASMGSKVTPAMARAVAGTQIAAEVVDVAAMGDQTIQLVTGWDKMSGSQRAASMLNIAFWGGMTAASARASGGPIQDGLSFNRMEQRLRVGSGYDMRPNANMADGEIRVAYNRNAEGKIDGYHIEFGGDLQNIDRSMIQLHDRTATAMRRSANLDRTLNKLIGNRTPEPGSAAWEARFEIDKINAESAAIDRALQNPNLTADQVTSLTQRQAELDGALRTQEARLNSPDATSNGFVAAPKTLEQKLDIYSREGAIVRGVPDNTYNTTIPKADATGNIDYGSVNQNNQALGIEATITKDMLNTGTHADGDIRPPGFVNGRTHNHSRGHLLARMLGGTGDDIKNLVTLYQNRTNSPVMRDFEQAVYDAVDKGEVVNYKVTPIYDGDGLPTSVAISARGSNGFEMDITIMNKDR